jgi:hypothetical protein
MAVIGVTITESTTQLLAGIPQSVVIESSIPASIFYTLDGSEPTTDSNIYVGPVTLPTTSGTVVLKIFVTDGVDSSPIITKTYAANMTGARLPHTKVLGQDTFANNQANLFPFGNPYQVVPSAYGTSAGIIVDSPELENIPDGYDGTATGTAPSGTDQPLSTYDLIFSTANSLGERGHGIGTLPANVTIPPPVPPNTSSNVNDKFFNPRALVIYQDGREPPTDPNVSQLNRQFFSLEDPERIRNGALLFNTALDGSQPTGSFVRAHYNPRDNTTTYYYFDSATLRWIISKEPCQPKTSVSTGLFNIAFSSRQQGSGVVFKWMPFVGRKLI